VVVISSNRQRKPAQPGAAKHSPHERGIALVVVMGFIFALIVLAAAFSINMRVEAILAKNANSEADVEWLCRSGVEFAKYILGQQMANNQEPYDCLSQSWAGGPGSTNGINPILEHMNLTNNTWSEGTVLGFLFPDESPGDKVRCSIKIIDLERKFNINRAAEDNIGRWPLENTFNLMGVDNALIPYLVDAIKDWRDKDEDRRISGVEDEYYQPLGYTAKNGPIDDLQELLLIRYITPKMYWGNRTKQLANTSLTASPAAEEEEEEPDYPIGLVDLYTPISVGYININTASMEVLQLLPGMDENRAAYIVDLRAGIDNVEGTYDDQPFTNIQEIRNVPGFQTPEAIANAQRFLSVRSATFEVTVTAEMRDQQRTLVAVLSRSSPKDVKILYTYWK